MTHLPSLMAGQFHHYPSEQPPSSPSCDHPSSSPQHSQSTMSGRAVRRALQRQREAELLKAQQAPSAEPSDAEELDSEPPAAAPKQSLFALLNQDNDDDDDDEDEPLSDHESDEDDTPAPVVTKPAPKAKSSKKKKKKKAKEKAAASKEEEESEDEIDRALRQLNLTSPAAEGEGEGKAAEKKQIELSLPDVLKVDAKNLDAGNEMRRLFGRDAMRGERAEEPAAPRGARGRGRAGQGRPMPTGRKNPLVQPKEEWPNVGSGGLAMEVVIGSETAEDLRDEANGVVEYRFIHSRHYQDVQRQFMMCVEAMGEFPDIMREILLTVKRSTEDDIAAPTQSVPCHHAPAMLRDFPPPAGFQRLRRSP